MSVKKDDTVKILKGKDRGKTGKVSRVLTKKGLVFVPGVNVYKKHLRPKRQGEKGEVVSLVRPLRISNVRVMCPSCSRAVGTGNRLAGDTKVRYCKKCGAVM